MSNLFKYIRNIVIICLLFFNKAMAVNYNMSNSTISTCSANFYDNGGNAANYGANQNLTMTINPATPGQYINVNFSSFALQNAADFLYIYDGTNTSAPLMGIYTGTYSPGTIGARNPSGALTFKFISNGGTQLAGWSATISCSTPGTTGNYLMTNNAVDTICTANFYDSGGSGNNYTANENSTMTFYPSTAGTYMSVIFSLFATSNNSDFFYIYDGPNNSSPLVGKYSGSTSPDTIVARNPSGCLTFVFTSNATGQTTGWIASLSCSATPGSNSGSYPMTNNAVDTICGGKFYDTGGSGNNYNASENNVMTFYPSTPGQYISVSFSSFQTESARDYLYIYDGPSIASPIIGIYSGLTNPVNIGARNALGCLTFKYTSNGSTQNIGWIASINCSPTPGSSTGVYPMTNGANLTLCSGTFYDSNGPSNYSANENITTTIYPETPGTYLQIIFSAFLTQANTDLFYIYDGPSTTSPLIGIYSGAVSPVNIAARNALGCLTFVFTSNGATGSTGWTATLACSPTPGTSNGVYPLSNGAVVTTCGGFFYDGQGSAANYIANIRDTTTFYPATIGQYLQLDFTAFQTESFNDQFYVFDGSSVSAPLIAIYSGLTSPVSIVARNPLGCITIVFVSNASAQFLGWAATISCSATPGTSTGVYPISNNAVDTICGGIFYDIGGSAGNYRNSQNETMTFFPATAGQYLMVNFSGMLTEGFVDFLYIYDGTSASAPLLGRYSGSSSPCSMTATNSDGALTFKFTSNGATVNTGWVATLSCVASACANSGCYSMTNNGVTRACGGIFYDSGGSLSNYTTNENSTTTFYPTSGQYVQLVFTSFLTQAATDFLYIYDGPSIASPLIGTYSGVVSPGTVTSTHATGALTVRFTSNGSVQNTGWAANVLCTGSVGTTTWTGANNTVWTQISNWANNCTSPSCPVNALIPPTANNPRISVNTNVKNITIDLGATLTIDPGVTLSVCGDFTNNGSIVLSNTSTLLFNNASVVQNISGSITAANRIGNIVISKTGGSVILGSDIDIGGSLVTSDNLSIFNSSGRNLKIYGDFINASGSTTFTNTAGGTIEFTGSTAQNFSPGGLLALNNVIVNKAAGDLTLVGNNLILGSSGVLTLTSGKIITGVNETVVQNVSISSITGYNNSNFVQGYLRRFISGSPALYDFPVGNLAKGFQNINIAFTTATAIPDIVASFDFWPSVPVGPVSSDCSYNADYSLLPSLNNGYWTLTPSANPNSGSYDVMVNNNNYSNQAPASYWTVMQANNPAGPWSLAGNCDSTSTVAVSYRRALNGFGHFATGQAPNTLPVSLVSFTGKNENRKNNLDWITASEINNSYFIIEKSLNGIDFFNLGTIRGAGNSTIRRYYSFADENPYPESFYKLKQVDFNGNFKYSETISIKSFTRNHFIDISPNPNKGNFKIIYNGKAGEKLIIKVLDIYGREVYFNLEILDQDFLNKEIDLVNIGTGIYFVEMYSETEKIFSHKLFIE